MALKGLEILADLCQIPNRPSVIVVSSAGGKGTDMTIKALQAGALEFICKPTGPSFDADVCQDQLASSWRVLVDGDGRLDRRARVPGQSDHRSTSLNNKSQVTVVEAKEGMELKNAHVYIAPGGRHMTIKR